MIVFDLRCAGGHVFEAWFASGDAYEKQRGDGRLTCPICSSAEIVKAPMAPAVAADRAVQPPPAAMKAAMKRLAEAQSAALANSTWVGASFAVRARAMHVGDEPHATIHGQATAADVRALSEDGVPVTPLPLPVIPPDQVN